MQRQLHGRAYKLYQTILVFHDPNKLHDLAWSGKLLPVQAFMCFG
jgi:hypothetical protein